MPRFEVTYNITGRACAIVGADSLEEAQEKAEKLDIVEDSCDLIEWEYDEVLDVSQ